MKNFQKRNFANCHKSVQSWTNYHCNFKTGSSLSNDYVLHIKILLNCHGMGIVVVLVENNGSGRWISLKSNFPCCGTTKTHRLPEFQGFCSRTGGSDMVYTLKYTQQKKETHHLDIHQYFLIKWTQKFANNFIQATLINRVSIWWRSFEYLL